MFSFFKRGLVPAVFVAVVVCRGSLAGASTAGAERVRPKYTVVVLMDGVSARNFYYNLDAGNLPNMDRYLASRGVRVENALCCVPSCTFDSVATLLTGTYSSRHGIPATRWFNPTLGIVRQYNSVNGSGRAQNDLRSPTVFRLISPTASVNSDFTSDATWCSSLRNWRGISFFLKRWQLVDRLAIEEIARFLQKKKDRPLFTFVHLVGSDATGHKFGPYSFRYLDDLYHYDNELGKTFRRLEKAGVLCNTLVFLIADHGMEFVEHDKAVSPEELADYLGMRLEHPPASAVEHPQGAEKEPPGDCVMIPNGDRVLFIHFRLGKGWPSRVRDNMRIGLGGQFIARDVFRKLLAHPSVETVCYRTASRTIRVLCQEGEGEIRWRAKGAGSIYWARSLKGCVPLWRCVDEKWAASGHTREEWLKASCQSAFPDAVVQLAEFFGCKNAPPVAAFAPCGANFAKGNIGAHGGLHRVDMNVPMLVAGPGVGRGRILAMRLVDIVPTALDMMGLKVDAQFDGVSRAEELRHPKTTGLLAK